MVIMLIIKNGTLEQWNSGTMELWNVFFNIFAKPIC